MTDAEQASLANDAMRVSRVAIPKGLGFAWLHEYLADRFPFIGAAIWCERLQAGKVSLETGQVLNLQTRYQNVAGLRLHYVRESPDEPLIPFAHSIVFEDECILIVDKPHFVPVVPAGKYTHQSLLWRLRAQGFGADLTPAHRIDQHTAGLVLWIKRPADRAAYQNLFRDRAVLKTYEAIAPFNPSINLPMCYQSRLETGEHFMQMRTVAGEPNCETRIELIAQIGKMARYQLLPKTGKRHQLRAQMAALALPIENDPIYPTLKSEDQFLDFSKPLKLLAKRLEFNDPISKHVRHFESKFVLELNR
jgi:tRNA pseudouridine32 synthase / 23S rRNA pseudouridine746 synthase